MNRMILALALVATASVAQAGTVCENGRCRVRGPAEAVVVGSTRIVAGAARTVVRTTERVVTAPGRVICRGRACR